MRRLDSTRLVYEVQFHVTLGPPKAVLYINSNVSDQSVLS